MSEFVSICIFARNEERHLHRTIGALDAAARGVNYRAHILVNGCTDRTIEVANMLAALDKRISVMEMPVGDKAHAWNDYVFRIAPIAKAHIFLDGDITPSAGSISSLTHTLAARPKAFGAAALPASGRSQRKWARQLLADRGLSGNLYALSEPCLSAFRRADLRLPLGAKGEDGLIAYLLLTDLKGGPHAIHRHRLVVDANATFEFDSIGLTPHDLSLYVQRLRRYSERHFQKKILYARLKSEGVGAMPDIISEIYTPDATRCLKPRLDPVNFWIDLAMLKRLRSAPDAGDWLAI